MQRVQQQPADDSTLNKYSLEYTFEELQSATRDFASECKLGGGAFGTVFHGIQSDGTDVAVKVLEVPEEAGFEEEVRVLSKFRHPNLVILMGFARRGPQRLLVYELLAGGDVYKRLQKSTLGEQPFPWRQRVSAAFDACCGLSHLHHASPKVFHRDIKSPNILLDRNGSAKMADFGLACLSHTGAHKVEKAAGTIGYACPLYAQRCIVTEGSEVYSFGIVLLEMLTASPPAWVKESTNRGPNYKFLVCEIRGDVDIALALADANAKWPAGVARAVAELALRCTSREESARPNFIEVVNALRKLRDTPDDAEPSAPDADDEETSPTLADPVGASLAGEATLGGFTLGTPRLWSLECVFAKGLEIETNAHVGRTLLHRQDAGLRLASHFKVGRLVQPDFFRGLLADASLRGMVSREHFQIWAEQANDELVPDSFSIGRVPCSFFLANLSSSWTMVNDVVLDDKARCLQLHDGDVITLGRKLLDAEGVCYEPLLQLRFDLSGSVLFDVSAREQEVNQPHQLTAAVAPGRSAGLCMEPALQGGIRPRFVLELSGTGVRSDADAASRVLVHGPEAHSSDEATGAFAPLVLGCGYGTAYWRQVLVPEAFGSMAWEHVAFDAVLEPGARSAEVVVRSCSYAFPLYVCTKEFGSAEHARVLDPNDRHVLRHGDVVVLVPKPECMVCLSFRDLLPSWHCSFAGGA